MTDLLLVPLEDTVVFPGMNVTLTVDVGDEDRVVLVPRHESEYAAVGTVAEVTDRVRIRGGMRAVTLDGLHRAVIGAAHTDALGRLRAEVEERPDENPPPVQTRELEREYRAVVEEILDLRDADDRVREFLRAITEAGALADTCAYAPDITLRAARRAARDGRRRRAPEARAGAPAGAARRAAGSAPASATTSRRARRSSSASGSSASR